MILCISGKRGSGKSLLAKALNEYGFHTTSLAAPLKTMCMELYGLNDAQVYGKDKESPTQFRRTDGSFYTPRDILIREGCLKRSIDPLFWCRKLDVSGYYNFVIDDIRFKNEVKYFKDLGAKFIRIEREQALNVYKAAMDDLSETELDSYGPWDFKLEAFLNKTPHDLKVFAEHIVENL